MIDYYLITKPGIIMGNLVTFAAGFLLASHGVINYWLFMQTLIGLAFIMASACVFNNYIDRGLDEKMERTKHRALVSGAISKKNALLFAVLLGLFGGWILFRYTNLLAVTIAGIGFFVYVVLYSFWKGRTIYGTAIGSVAGAVPPVVGYCAVNQHLDAGALILFSMLVFWQMPHFFAIAMAHKDDYTRAKIPVLPIEQGAYPAKVRMVIYIVAFIVSAALLTVFGYAGYLYLSVAVLFGVAWLVLCLQGFQSQNDQLWAKQMFKFSLILIGAVSLVIPFDTIP